MYHSVTFGEKNSWTDWHLVANSRPVISPPKVKTQYVDIPGADGSIDLTDSLAGRAAFEDREGSIEFLVLNDFNIDNYDYNWIEVYTSIMQYLHGKRMTMILEDDPQYYYEGRFSVNSWKSDRNNSTITIDYRVSPYKYRVITQTKTDDLERGSFGINKDTNEITEDDSESARLYHFRTIEAKPYHIGDSIRILNQYSMDIWLFDESEMSIGGEVEFHGKGVIWSGFMYGNRYEFTDSGYYRLSVQTPTITQRELSDADFPKVANAIRYYTGGIL